MLSHTFYIGKRPFDPCLKVISILSAVLSYIIYITLYITVYIGHFGLLPRWGLAPLCLPSSDIARPAPAAADVQGKCVCWGGPRSSDVILHHWVGRRFWASSLPGDAAAHHTPLHLLVRKNYMMSTHCL